MGKSKVRVRRLTLAPHADTGSKEADVHRVSGEAEDQNLLDLERLSRATEISLLVGEGS
jgi:hypothetical protein